MQGKCEKNALKRFLLIFSKTALPFFLNFVHFLTFLIPTIWDKSYLSAIARRGVTGIYLGLFVEKNPYVIDISRKMIVFHDDVIIEKAVIGFKNILI